MLRELHIRSLGVIDEARIELHPGLTVVTGETGAGKTMVVTGLGLVLGGRADPTLVRPGSEGALVEADLVLPGGHPALRRAEEAGGDVDGGELLLARGVVAGGRSRAHVGGRRAPAGLLAEIGELVVAVHGQADQWRLTRPAQHRAVLDDVGGPQLRRLRGRVADLVAEHRERRGELDELVADERERVQEIDRLTYQLEQIDAVEPEAGEDEGLAAEEDRLAHAEELLAATATAHRLLSDPDASSGPPASTGPLSSGGGGADVVGLVAAADRALDGVAAHDPRLAELHQRLGEIGVLVADVAADLGAYAADVEVDPVLLARTQERRAAVADLLRRYGPDVTAVLAHRDAARERLGRLAGADGRIASLRDEVDALRGLMAQAADQLTQARREAAAGLAADLRTELTALGMARAVVEVAVEPRASGEIAADGGDEVEIRVAVNPGSPPRSVARAASGGELSRIMLALEVAGADRAEIAGADRADPVDTTDGGGGVGDPQAGVRPTFVFDEVDAGVGGRAGLDVGSRLARLAETSQVVVVTHLAQVAAHADRHLVVRKRDDGHVTSSDIGPVEGEERLRELARMMGGGDTSTALEHARELLGSASGRPRGTTRAPR